LPLNIEHGKGELIMGDEKKKNAGRKIRNLTAEQCKSILSRLGNDMSVYRTHVLARARELGIQR
jgi:hypothetical protein